MKTIKITLVALGCVCIILLCLFLIQRHHNNKKKYEVSLLLGNWTELSESETIKLNADSTFKLFIHGSEQNFEGKWTVIKTYLDNDTLTLLVLKNKKEKEYSKEENFSYYFFKIDSVKIGKLKLTDLSGQGVRMNKNHTFKLEN